MTHFEGEHFVCQVVGDALPTSLYGGGLVG